MSSNLYYKSGSWNVICDVCGKKIKAHEAKHRWDGFVVCAEDYEQRHPQDYIRARQDKISVPFTRPRPVDAFITRSVLADEVMVTDSEMGRDYLVNLTSYFAEDYMQDYSAFKIVMNWNRSVNDLVIASDVISMSISKPLEDTVLVTDTIYARKTITRTFDDSVLTSDNGSIFWENYIESTYFAEDYVGTVVNFIT